MITRLTNQHRVLLIGVLLALLALLPFIVFLSGYRGFRGKGNTLKSGVHTRDETFKTMGCGPGNRGFRSYSIERGIVNQALNHSGSAIWSDNDCAVVVIFSDEHVHSVYFLEPASIDWTLP